MCAKLSFDATKVAPQKPMDPVPKGWYPAMVTESSVEGTKADPKNCTRLNLEVEIIDGDFKGRKAWDGLNTKNKNPKAQEIGLEQLSALCHAVGVFKFNDTAELHRIPFEIKLGFESEREELDASGKPTGTIYDARNTFKGFRPLAAGAAGAPAGAAPAATAPGATVPAWANKQAGKAAPTTAAPAAAPAAKASPPAPGKPKAPGTPPPVEVAPEPAPEIVPGGEQAERQFYVYVDDDSKEVKGSDLAIGLGDGTYTEETPVMPLDDEISGWKVASDFGIEAFSESAPVPTPAPVKAPPAAPGAKTPPWKKGK
jgi:hypothetical protein